MRKEAEELHLHYERMIINEVIAYHIVGNRIFDNYLF